MSTAFSTFTTSAPRVVGIGYGIFQTPENPVEPQVITVPVDYSLYFGAPIPDTDLGSTGDYYFRNTSDSAIIYRKLNNVGWSVVTLITGGSVADLTAIYNDIITINGELTNIESTVTSILSNYATQDFVETKKTEAITISNSFATASVATEAAVRATADGFLEGKYTLKVTAGNVVTGMNITSSTGGGADVSSVIFQADKFEIWNGSSAQAVFSLSGSDVTISGWKINPNTLTGGNVTLNSTGVVTAGTGDDVAIMSAANVTYRFWCGAAAPGSAPFSVTKDGDLVATSATITGSVTATSGAIGGFVIGSDYIRDVANSMGLASTVTGGDDVRFFAGSSFAGRASAPFRIHESGAIFSTSGTVGGFTLGATSFTAGAGANKIEISNAAGPYIKFGVFSSTAYTEVGLGGIANYNAAGVLQFQLAGTDLTVAGVVNTAGGIAINGTSLTISPTVITFTSDTNLYRSAANTLKTDDALVVTGACTAASFSGDGSALTALNASQLTSGTLPNARLSFTATGSGDVPINGFVNVGGVKFATVA